MNLAVLYEDNHLLIVNKPAMLPTMGVESPRESVLSVAKEYIKQKYNKPGNVYLGVVSRLDAPVTGVLLIARTSKAANRLNVQFREKQVEKVYFAAVAGAVKPESGECVHFVRKDERHRKVHVCGENERGAKEARLTYETLSRTSSHTLLQVMLETGRKHQIRVQLAEMGHPIIGDRKYGSRREFPKGIALHSWRLTFDHPVGKSEMKFNALLPKSWKDAGIKQPLE